MLFCNNCVCNKCPYGLSCDYCDNWLDGHILIIDGCDGLRDCSTCPLDEMMGEGADILRELLKSKDDNKIDLFFEKEYDKYYHSWEE